MQRNTKVGFERFFNFISYAAVFCGFLSLWVSGGYGIIGASLFTAVMIAAWLIEGSRWQVSERVGTLLIVLALPVYYLISRFQIVSVSGGGIAIAGVLGRLIVTLTAIKLLQRKSDRDWIFLYLMSFFEILLAAGLSISALYLVTFVLYLLTMVCAVIAFEIRKTSRTVADKTKGLIRRTEEPDIANALPFRRLPSLAAALIAVIVCAGLPLFFFLPRVGGAGFGGGSSGVSTRTGFSDTVRLGRIGEIQQNNEVVMRARLDGVTGEQSDLYWRGVALDTFDGRSWSRSNRTLEVYLRGDRALIPVDFAANRENVISQTIYLEPLDTSVLFGLPRVVGIQTGLASVYKDADGGVGSNRPPERISYRVYSDRSTPAVSELRLDEQRYPSEADRFLELPDRLDPRIAVLTKQVVDGRSTRYDKARAVEQYLQTQFGYTLDMKAGGEDPLADFLFNVREGHCEYFATAMAIMLRTQGIATRVVNGFHQGDYNEAADVYVVRQRNAHSWVEVYFPGSNAWVKFDPTPPAGQTASSASTGLTGQVTKYVEALETLWIQYFVAYDNREQQSLTRSVQTGFVRYQQNIRSYLASLQAVLADWWSEVRGDRGGAASISAIGYAVAWFAGSVAAIVVFVWLSRRIVKLKIWRRIADWIGGRRAPSIVEFYDRMLKILARQGFVRQPFQTPLEFAFAVGSTEALRITEKYNRVRFGEKYLTTAEWDQIDKWLKDLADTGPHN